MKAFVCLFILVRQRFLFEFICFSSSLFDAVGVTFD